MDWYLWRRERRLGFVVERSGLDFASVAVLDKGKESWMN